MDYIQRRNACLRDSATCHLSQMESSAPWTLNVNLIHAWMEFVRINLCNEETSLNQDFYKLLMPPTQHQTALTQPLQLFPRTQATLALLQTPQTHQPQPIQIWQILLEKMVKCSLQFWIQMIAFMLTLVVSTVYTMGYTGMPGVVTTRHRALQDLTIWL